MGTNTGLGIGIGIPFKNNALGGDKPYFPPELKARMIGVWTNYGKKNTDADRNIIKNKIPNAGGDLEILNAAYKLNSGFGEYSEDFTTWLKSSKITSVNSESFDFITNVNWALLSYKSNIGKDISSFKVRIKLKGKGKVYYNYITLEGVYTNKVITSEEYVTPISYNTKYTGETPVNCGFTIGIISDECSGTITQIPNFEDAFVTDGVNDIIISQKTLQEMGVTKGLTIVSMIHQISWRDSASVPLTNYIRPSSNNYVRSHVSNIGKTGIYGYVCYDISNSGAGNSHVVNTILGDKNDYSINIVGDLSQGKFSVQGYMDGNGNILETSSVAHYWTFAVLGKVTEDEINLIIGNYNLDRSLKPDILCNIGKQGITNDNHADFNDKLIDYSGNGRDIQMNNLAWKGGSGIAAKQYETFKDWTSESSSTSIIKQIDEFTRIVESTTNGYWVSRIRRDSDLDKVYSPINVYLYQDNNSLIHECKYKVDGVDYTIPIYERVEKGFHQLEIYSKDRYTELPENAENIVLSEWYYPRSTKGSIKYSIIPSCKGGILLDGINDFGKVTGMPIYKDYTVIVDYERISGIEQAWAEALISKSYIANQGAFVLMETNGTAKHSYSFGAYTTFNKDDSTRTLLYQSKYKCGNVGLNADTGVDGDTLWLGTYRDNYNSFFNGAIYSLMSFPYSMSEFLIERQLKKHKLGTLYPDMVELRPVIKTNANYKITYYQIDSTNTWKSIKVGDYIVIGAKLAFQITFDNDASELKEVVSPQLSGIIVEKRPSNPGYNIYSYITSKSPQKINITIDEYIRFEDIVQPYPVIFQIKDRNTNQRYSWGDKIKVGSSIQLFQSENPNLLSGLYSIQSYEYEGKAYSYNQLTNLNIILTKQSISLSCNKTWLLDDNEPKCILSPRLLRIPNSSYKILGYIPDISGHGNHGKINNSAYEGMSGVNGYPVVFGENKTWANKSNGYVTSITSNTIHITNVLNAGLVLLYSYVKYNGNLQNIKEIPPFKIEIKGLEGRSKFIYKYLATSDATKETNLYLGNGTHELPKSFLPTEALINNAVVGFSISPIEEGVTNFLSDITIKVLSEYEGAYCLDGVDDFVTIPTTVGGKQMLMKVNWQKSPTLLYDQRASGSFAVLTTKEDDAVNSRIAYQGRNQNGKTYIDGIENNNIETYTLKDITHNITIANSSLGAIIVPAIGCNTGKTSSFAKMSLYDFMLFDEISTDDKIKELNEYVGIEAKVELPPYYWDTYGKTNSDADRDTIQQRGVAVGDYDLTNTNFAYDKMSGFGGYEFEKFTDTTKWIETKREDGIEVIEKNDYSFTAKKVGTGQYFWDFKNNRIKTLDRDLTVKAISNNNVYIRWEFKYRTAEKPDIDSTILLLRQAMTPNVPITVTLPYKTQEEQTELGVVEGSTYYLFYFDPSDIPVGDEYTVEMLPLYTNGLVYDGITDYSKNANIPALDDFTAIIKREWLKKQGCPLIKGSKVYEGGNGNALLLEWDKAYNFVFYKRTDIMEGELPDNISFITPTNYNGNVITRGSEQDTNGICIAGDGNAGFANMVFYKLILYPKTIPLLQINFLKNLMERDEIIDLNNKIFIKNE